MVTRRKFLGMVPAALALGPMISDAVFRQDKMTRRYGFITGIVGKELEGDWRSVLKQIASMGYTEMEGEYFGESPESFIHYLNTIGLKFVAGGLEFGISDEQLNESLNTFRKLEAKIAVVYWPWNSDGPFTINDCKVSAERLNYIGRICSKNGIEFCWHNHDKEFLANEKGLPFDYLMNNTDPEHVKCELDIYWTVKGGADPVQILQKYRGRFNILHIKDMAPGEKRDFDCPGSGIIDFPAIFREADKQGIKHFMVERDNVPDGMACLKSASDYFKRLENLKTK